MFQPAILDSHKQLTRRFDQVLSLKNSDPLTVEHDALYALLRLGQIVGAEFPSADQTYHWQTERISFHLPSIWTENQDAYWLAEAPLLEASYDEVLQADDALVIPGETCQLAVTREFKVDNVLAKVYIRATIPQDVVSLLFSLEKLIVQTHEASTSTNINC